LLAGFVNFEAGLGLALLAAACDARIALWQRPVAFGARFALGGATMVAHPFGGLFYLALLVGLAAGERYEMFFDRKKLRPAMMRALISGAPIILALSLIVFLGPELPTPNKEYPVVWQDFNPWRLLSALTIYFRTYDPRLDALVFAVFAGLLALAAVRGRVKFHAGLVVVAMGMSVAASFVPAQIMGTSYIHVRLPSMIVLMLAAGLRPSLSWFEQEKNYAVALSLLVVFLRTAHVTTVWRAADADLTATRQALATVEPGATVLPVQYAFPRGTKPPAASGRMLGGSHPNYWHYPSLAVVDRKAFIPWLFSVPGKQPLRVLHPWSEIAINEIMPPVVDELTPQFHSPLLPIRQWRDLFDYVLLINADIIQDGVAIEQIEGLTLVSDRGFARLYRVANRKS
jgi:hypothetical protein